MNYGAGQNCLCAVYHKEWCESGGAIRRGSQPPEYGVELLYPVHIGFFKGPHQSGFDAAHDETICTFDLTVSLWVIDRSIVELNAQVSAPQLYFIRGEVCAVIGDNTMGDTIMVYDPDMKSITGPDSAVLTGLASIHLVNLSTMTNRYFILWVPPLRGPTISSPQTAKSQVMGMVRRALGGIWL